MRINELREEIRNGSFNEKFAQLYQDSSLVDYQQQRYLKAVEKFAQLYDEQEVEIYSAAGRSEICGNHTDHQKGKVIAASINLDAIAVVAERENRIKILSDDFDIREIDINDLQKKEEEAGTSEALVRGVVHKLKEQGYNIGGFNAYITSDVIIGAGLSSSAAFEVLIGTIINGLYNEMKIDMVEIAKISQYSENVYFGKPCGLMDQCACGIGGLINIDFKDTSKPVVKKIDVDFSAFNSSLCIVDTKGNHADLTNDYAAIPAEMKQVARFFGKEVLREVDENEFVSRIDELRKAVSDRAVLRAFHFFNEDRRVDEMVSALENRDYETFKKIIEQSGNSSYKYLQNIYSNSDYQNQAVSLGLAFSQQLLVGKGVCRVHGGGFAGTIQAFVDNSYVQQYKTEIEKIFGEGSCHVLKIRNVGGAKVIA